ncbi:glycoside hydrolase family 16 protein [Belliella sp. DSM 111904]|uniref:Glycoside hydrolase family 16 protein n=1 Tax=Belliella filtrata TaxID=2923435 RepID=A0ABS9V5M3_9BACT|nr:glycoside hydrolase family 16 protein [Belliella filtrata]MCH7411504.1 glycoside hydrolase family 16 protein [Belliella filtrata]
MSCKLNSKLLTERVLVWSDEFDVEGLPNPAHWVFEEGHVRNQESQYYTKERPENAYVRNGKLYITAKKEKFPNKAYESGSKDWRSALPASSYTSASITTAGLHSWQYGRVEVRAKLPKGKGVWPAIWMLGDNFDKVDWPYSGEIDIMEHVGKDPKQVHGTVHYPTGEGDAYNTDGGQTSVKGLSGKFHVFAIEWDENAIHFYVNDQLYHSFEIDDADLIEDNPFRQKHFLLINLALGGAWPGPIADEVLPQEFVIDYVRVYQ